MDILNKAFEKVKQTRDLKTDTELANYLGASPVNVAHWRKTGMSPTILVNVLEKFERATVGRANERYKSELIHPIVEFLPIARTPANEKMEKWLLFRIEKDGTRIPFLEGLKKRLEVTDSGAYIFYNSSGIPLYVGQVGRTVKTSKKTNNLWNELTDAFNRQGLTRVIYGDPVNYDEEFRTVRERGPKVMPTKKKRRLCEVATSFSAYEVAPGMAGTIEALLIRVTANMLFNDRMESL